MIFVRAWRPRNLRAERCATNRVPRDGDDLQVAFMRGKGQWLRTMTGTFIMGHVVFLYRSLAYRHAAAEMLRKARTLPQGPERHAAQRYAMALRDLAQTEAWLEGRTANGKPQMQEVREFRRRAGRR
jgi:hypothetical protein